MKWYLPRYFFSLDVETFLLLQDKLSLGFVVKLELLFDFLDDILSWNLVFFNDDEVVDEVLLTLVPLVTEDGVVDVALLEIVEALVVKDNLSLEGLDAFSGVIAVDDKVVEFPPRLYVVDVEEP